MREKVERGKLWPILVATIWAVGLSACTEVVVPGANDLEPGLEGVVIEAIGEASTLEKAGLRPGDVVWAWERLPNPPANPEAGRGTIESVFDWMWLEVEQAPRGTLKLFGERAGVKSEFEVKMGRWGAKVRPQLQDRMLEVYVQGRDEVMAGEIEKGVGAWSQLAKLGREKDAGLLANWIQMTIGEVWFEARAWGQARMAYLAALEGFAAPVARVAIQRRVGTSYERQSEWNKAEDTYRSALAVVKASWGRCLYFAEMNNRLGDVAYNRGLLDLASLRFQNAFDIIEQLAPESLELARSLKRQGDVAQSRGDLELATVHHKRALEIRWKLVPNGLELSESLLDLGNVALIRGDTNLAARYYHRTLETRERLAPDSLELARVLISLGNLAIRRDQRKSAMEYYQRATKLKEALALEGLEMADLLGDLGRMALLRNDFELAETLQQRALELCEKLAPDSLRLVSHLGSLGDAARQQRKLDLASAYFHRALDIQEKLAPGNPVMGQILDHMSNLAEDQGQIELAIAYSQRALKIKEKQIPDTLNVAITLNNLGNLARIHGQLELAATHLERAIEIFEKLAPDSAQLAASLNNLGIVASDLGQWQKAINCLLRSLAIKEKFAPGGRSLAEILNNLGVLYFNRGQLKFAAEYFQRAVDIQMTAIYFGNLGETLQALGDIGRAADSFERAIHEFENRISTLDSSHDTISRWRAQHSSLYRDFIECLLQLHRHEDAFATLEASRGRGFLALLTEKELLISDIPEELARERRDLAVAYERTQNQLVTLNPINHVEQIDQLTAQLRYLRHKYDTNTGKIRRTSPKVASLRYPEPLDLKGVRHALDPGTVMLSYSVGEKQTDLFVLTREGPLRVHSLAIGESTLRDQLARFDRHVQGRNRAERHDQGRVNMAKWFFRQLVEPASETIAENDRLLLVLDGPLHRLAFAALIRETGDRKDGPERGWQYLVEWKPLHTVLSGTVYAELRKLRRKRTLLHDGAPSPVALVAFGDPEYPHTLARGEDLSHDAITDVFVRDAAEQHGIHPLPYTRTEVEAIAGLFGPQPVLSYLGKDATEERAKALGIDARIVHFATHGLLNDEFPLNSALALTLPERFSEDRENGLLQVWEIFEHVRLDADLVVLSACQTAMGQEQFGEGLIGLSRAFQYAGARSVLASLWSVSDRTTAELMSRFYLHVKSGKTWDEALRAAQLALIRGEVQNERGDVASAPFYWAAFQVIGDWQ